MSGFQAPITISQALGYINRNGYLLPSFQREFVWTSDQIEQLFDSLMKGYPISSMLFWKVRGSTKTDFKFYSFLKEYRQRFKIHNQVVSTDNLNDFSAVLDGQQRLTALNIGLNGSYAYKEYRKNWTDNEISIPTRLLYLNITKVDTDDIGMDYEFKFLKRSETEGADLIKRGNNKWFRIGRILSLHKEDYDLDDFVDDHEIKKEEKKVLRRLEKMIFTDLLINYYEEDEQKPDKAVNIFIRINSGGTHLSFSDILMSVAVANWKQKDARTEIHNLVDAIRAKGYTIDKDFVLKAFLYLYHKDVRFQINSFNNDFIEKIETNWENIRNAIINLFDLIKTFGFNDYTLTAKNATLPILYYIYHRGIFSDFSKKIAFKDDRETIERWLHAILIRRIFSGQTDTVLAQTRKGFTDEFEKGYINNGMQSFPSGNINNEVKKYGDVGDEYLEELLKTQKDNRFCFSILALLYPNLDYKNNDFHKDHLHPEAKYENLSDDDKNGHGWQVYNSILNLQMLDSNENMAKQDKDLKEWLAQETKKVDWNRFLDNHIIPDTDFALTNFSTFISLRKKLLLDKLKSLLN